MLDVLARRGGWESGHSPLEAKDGVQRAEQSFTPPSVGRADIGAEPARNPSRRARPFLRLARSAMGFALTASGSRCLPRPFRIAHRAMRIAHRFTCVPRSDPGTA